MGLGPCPKGYPKQDRILLCFAITAPKKNKNPLLSRTANKPNYSLAVRNSAQLGSVCLKQPELKQNFARMKARLIESFVLKPSSNILAQFQL